MTVEEIFAKVAEHMLEGVMYHHDFARAYRFLGLDGFAKCHEYQYFAENKGFEELLCYYSSRYHKLLKLNANTNTDVIPETWYKYTTMAVDAGTKRTSTKQMIDKWVQWERDTKALYQEMYKALYDAGEIAAACILKKHICEVDDELKHAEKKMIKLETLGYDIGTIVGWQKSMYNKYDEKLKCLFK